MNSEFFANPFVQYIVSPGIVFSILLYGFYRLLDLGRIIEKINQTFIKVDKLENKFGSFEDKFYNLTRDVDIMRGHLVTKTGLDTSLYSANSPLTLEPKGKKLVKDSKFQSVFEANQKWFIKQIKSYKPKTLSELDEAAIEVIDKCADHNIHFNFKEFAFEQGLTELVVRKVFSIWLREELKYLVEK